MLSNVTFRPRSNPFQFYLKQKDGPNTKWECESYQDGNEKINSLSDQGIPEKISNRCGLLHAIDNFYVFMCMIEKSLLISK